MSKYIKLLTKITVISVISLTYLMSFAYAQTVTTTVPAKSVPVSIYNKNCGSKFKTNTDYQALYGDLYYSQQSDINNPQSGNTYVDPATGKVVNTSDLVLAGCPPSLDDITLIILRIVTVLVTVVGLVLFIAFVRNGINILTAGANKDRVKAGRAGFQSAIIGVLIVVLSYSLIVFVAFRLGLSSDPNNFSILEGPNLIFKFLFVY